eukprot:4757781-Amphidinium_carterae.1
MPGKIFKKSWWPSGPWQHYDPVPLAIPAHWFSDQSPRIQLAIKVVDAINRLGGASSRSGVLPRNSIPRGHRCTALQADCLQHILQCVDLYGEAPDDLDGASALAEIIASKDFYDEVPSNLCSFDLDKVKVIRGDIHTKPMQPLLSAEGAAYLDSFESSIELPPADRALAASAPDFPKPYFDRVLLRDYDSRVKFYHALVRCGVMGVRRSIKCEVGLFFVRKKDPAWIRLVVDARRTNRLHRRPPPVLLGSVEAACSVDLSELYPDCAEFGEIGELPRAGLEGRGYPSSSSADLRDGFYQLRNELLGSWFGIREKFTAEQLGATSCFDDSERAYVQLSPEEKVFPVIEALAMGWSWALWLCHDVCTQACLSIPRVSLCNVVRDRRPAPSLEIGQAVHCVYADNWICIAVSQEEAASNFEEFRRRARGVGFYMGDASSTGYAFMQTHAKPSEVRAETRFRERWRFISAGEDELLPLCEQHDQLVELARGAIGTEQYDEGQVHEGLLFTPPVCVQHANYCCASSTTSYRDWLDAVWPSDGQKSGAKRKLVGSKRFLIPICGVVPDASVVWDDPARWTT